MGKNWKKPTPTGATADSRQQRWWQQHRRAPHAVDIAIAVAVVVAISGLQHQHPQHTSPSTATRDP
jgi:hypothetical protein